MAAERCNNQNHSKMNVRIRFCSTCGEIVNSKIASAKCSREEHMKNRKTGGHYCSHCGLNLKTMS